MQNKSTRVNVNVNGLCMCKCAVMWNVVRHDYTFNDEGMKEFFSLHQFDGLLAKRSSNTSFHYRMANSSYLRVAK